MKKLLICILIPIFSTALYADDLKIFQTYVQKADSAYQKGDLKLCFSVENEIIKLFNNKKKKYIKNSKICKIVFDAYSSLAILDKSLNEEDICKLLANGLSLIDKNPAWLKDYSNKEYIISLYINLINGLFRLSEFELACKYNQNMIFFAEKYYKFEMASVLLTACDMYSLMDEFDRSYPLYLRLYEMLDDLDRKQQYWVVRELIHLEFKKDNYSKVAELSLKHEKLIAKSKDEIKDVFFDIIGLGFLRYANNLANDCDTYSDITDTAFETGCKWAIRNYPLIYPRLCIDYAYWLYGYNAQIPKALCQFELFLEDIEHTTQEKLFDDRYRLIVDAENALISIITQRIINVSKPSDLDDILNKYPKVVSAIKNEPCSRYYDDFNHAVKLAKKKCYGEL